MKTLYFSLLVTLSAALVSCGQPQPVENSLTKVTNGVRASQRDFPAVAQLSLRRGFSGSSCTGTWVNDHQVITAAHCVESNPTTITAGRRIRALGFVAQTGYDITLENGVNELDIAIVNFPLGSSNDFRELSTVAPIEEDPLQVVGFGNNVVVAVDSGIRGSGGGVLRRGNNTLNSLVRNMYAIVGVSSSAVTDFFGEEVTPGEFVSTGSGDSGGPLFFQDRLVGVTSGGGIGETEEGVEFAVGLFTDILSESSQSFLAENLD